MTATTATGLGHTRVLHPEVEPTSAVTLIVWDDGTGPSELIVDTGGPCPLNTDDVDRLIDALHALRDRMTPMNTSHPGPWDDTGGRR